MTLPAFCATSTRAPRAAATPTWALAIEHVGSTAVPGLAGKNVVDIDLTVTNPADEEAYVPALSSIGYILTVREPSWHQHRCSLAVIVVAVLTDRSHRPGLGCSRRS